MQVDKTTAPPQGVAVSLARHGALRWRKPQNWGFARRRNLVPIAMGDAVPMASAFALVFAGAEFVPCVLLALSGQDSPYIGADGAWLGAIIPPMLQAYPFDVVAHGAAELKLIVDENSGLLGQDPHSAPFFDVAGRVSPQMAEIIAFCRKHGDAARRAAPAVAVIDALGLFDPMGAGVFRINQARYDALPDRDILALRQAGALDLILAHFVSMSHLALMRQARKKTVALSVENDSDVSSFLAAMSSDSFYQDTALAALLNGNRDSAEQSS